jgi:polar amino acid transport system substrate-binding protein
VSSLAAAVAPTGTLRVAINLGNSVLARRNPDGSLGGITAAIGRELGRRLAVGVELVPYAQAGDVFAALDRDEWDVCFLAIEPVRAAKIEFTEPYITIDGVYLVPASSTLHDAADVDRAGTRVGVIVQSAYDLFLTRELKQATLTRLAGPDEVVAALRGGQVDLVAGVRPQLEADLARVPGSRLLPQPFMSIRQAMGVPRGRDAAASHAAQFIATLKREGWLRDAYARNRVQGGSLAP